MCTSVGSEWSVASYVAFTVCSIPIIHEQLEQ